MKRLSLPFLAGFCLLASPYTIEAQPATKTLANEQVPVAPAKNAAADSKAARDAEAARILAERRAQARSLLISLAADARNFSDQALRARTQARIADALWDADPERARTMFRSAWDAAEIADAEGQRRLREEISQQNAKTGGAAVMGPPNIRAEVLRRAARRDRALGEEMLAKLKVEKQQEATEASEGSRGALDTPTAISQRLNLARQLLDADVERALQFADPVLATVTTDGLDFLSSLRDRDAAAADQRYAAMLGNAAANIQSDANTVSLLSAYLFTPHLFMTFSGGGASSQSSAPTSPPPNVSPELRTLFFRAGADILLRPLAPPGQDQSSSGVEGKYMVIKRLMPLFDQFAPREITEAMHAQMEALSTAVSEEARKRDDDTLREGIRPPQKSEDLEQSLLDQIDRAKTPAERDRLYLQLARIAAGKNDMRARDYVEKIDDSELRQSARAFIDMSLVMRSVEKKDTKQALELARIGELSHLHRVWLLTQVSKLLLKTDREKALALLDDASPEAARIDKSDADHPRALLAIANVRLDLDRKRAWDEIFDAIKAANSAESFTGEDGRLVIGLQTKGMNSIRANSAPDFDVSGVFTELAKEDYTRAVDLARGFERDAPRASAVIAIARSVLEEKKN
ncbi:MAG TPA: hypothetical protein VLQ90_04680 [Pyrinomonadaceae bacterium]|nr:hypothetical protein [Pyrinomonadaceae bacterium]